MIRKTEFSKDDIDYIANAKKKGFFDGWTKDMIISGKDGGRLLGFIAENEKEQGFITFSEGLDGIFDLEDIFVEKSERKKGIGESLLSSFIAEAKERGGKKIFLEVRESNIPAINLYTKFGFEKISIRKKYYSDGENALVLVKNLEE